MNIFITGVSSGIGLSLAKTFLAQGHCVFAIGRNRPDPFDGNERFTFVSVDLASLTAIPGAVIKALAGVKHLDLVILNAGILGEIGDMAETSMDLIQQVMTVNVWANKYVLDTLFEKIASVEQVIAISSGAAVNGARGWNGYAISKAALNTLIRMYAAERVTTHFSALAPGLVDTGMQTALRSLPNDPRFPTVERLKKAYGTADMPTGDDVAPRLIQTMNQLRTQKSGDFHDLRTLK